MSKSYTIFDRALVKSRQEGRETPAPDYLFREGAAGLKDRLSDINRTFKDVLAFGPLIGPDFFKDPPDRLTRAAFKGIDEEVLDLPEASFDLVISNLTLHWVNDLPGALLQIRRVLKPDGYFLAVMLGGETLFELRQSLLLAEAEVTGGASPRVSPFVEIKDAGHLLQRAGFAMPVSDIDRTTVSFAQPLDLMRDLKAMGENNALLERKKTLTGKGVMAHAAAIYREKFADPEGRIPATFDFLHLSAWAPGPDQPKPLKPGSGKVDLRDVFDKKS